jgi:hypothetical protein
VCSYVQLDDTLAMEKLNAITVSSRASCGQKWKANQNLGTAALPLDEAA